jgi:hypothetical protein
MGALESRRLAVPKEGVVAIGKVTRFCACCGAPVTFVKVTNPETGTSKIFTDQTLSFHVGRLFLCSDECCATIVNGFGSVEAFEEWALSPASLAGVGASWRSGED